MMDKKFDEKFSLHPESDNILLYSFNKKSGDKRIKFSYFVGFIDNYIDEVKETFDSNNKLINKENNMLGFAGFDKDLVEIFNEKHRNLLSKKGLGRSGAGTAISKKKKSIFKFWK